MEPAMLCDRCEHPWEAHGDRAFFACVAVMRCECSGWLRELKPEGF